MRVTYSGRGTLVKNDTGDTMLSKNREHKRRVIAERTPEREVILTVWPKATPYRKVLN